MYRLFCNQDQRMKGKIAFLSFGYEAMFSLFHLLLTIAAGTSTFKVENANIKA